MKTSQNIKIIVYVPATHAEAVRQAMGDAGAGKVGNYTHCSFSSKGTGRFLPMEGAHPAIVKGGTMESVEEEKIEMICDANIVEKVISAMKGVHPYEEVAFEICSLLEI